MKILICDDHKIVRDGLRQIIQQLSEVSLIEEAGDATEVFALLNKNEFDIIVLDITLPGKSGLEILQTVKSKYPFTNVLMLSMHSEEQYAIRTFKLGASGYLTKATASEELLLAIRRISEGGKYVSQSLSESLATHFDRDAPQYKHEILSKREFQIMIKLAKGDSLQEIGFELFISNKTVGTYRSRIMAKMKFNRNTDLTKYCIENNLM